MKARFIDIALNHLVEWIIGKTWNSALLKSLRNMLTTTIEEIKHNLVTYLKQLEVGEHIVVMDAGHPIAEIRPISSVQQPRPFGLCAGEFVVPDDFDDPLPDEILSAFEGK